MQIFLIVMNLILVWVIIHQGKEIKDLEPQIETLKAEVEKLSK